MSNQDTVAAMRHLRSIVQSIASDENISPTGRQQKVKNFEQLLEQAEKKLHYQNNKKGSMMDDPLGLLNVGTSENKNESNNGKKKKTTENGEKKKKKKDKKEWKRKGWLKASKLLSGRSQRSMKREMLETLQEEDARGETEESHEGHTTIRDAPPLNVEVRANNDDDDDNTAGGDTIADMRAQNSEDYTASICSLRSLGTFEKDFINYVMAEQGAMNDDEVSCSTFEKDFMARQNENNGSVYPTQVEYNTNNGGGNDMNDGLTIDDAISETTFEQDARRLEPLKDQDGGGDDVVYQGNNNGVMQQQKQQQMMPPRMVQTANEDDVDDDLTVGTLDNDDEEQREQDDTPTPLTPAWGSTLGGMIKNAFSADNSMSVMSVSTFEKDAAALAALASKIGRKPSTQPKVEVVREEAIYTTDSDRSCGTFEKDQKARMMTRKQVSPRMSIGGIVNSPSAQSTSTFEKDFQVRQPKPNLSAIGEAISGAVSRQASGAAGIFGSSFSPSQQQPAAPLATRAQEVMPAPSNTAFERDSKPTVVNPAGWFGTTMSSNNNRQDMSLSGFEKDVSANMNNQHSNTTTNCEAGLLSVRTRSAAGSVKNIETDGLGTSRTGLSVAAREATAEAEATLKLSKISPLVVELSPAAIDKGIKNNKDSGGFWARFMCAGV